MRTYTIMSETGETAQITSDKVAEYRDFYLGDNPLGRRISELMWVDLYALDLFSGVDPNQVLDAVREVEAGDASESGVKDATRFTRLPLKGLWHKHYFSAQFVLPNIALGLRGGKIGALVDEVMAEDKGPIITREMIQELSRRVVNDPLEERSDAKRLTGEWIIYLPHGGQNYYLCCSTHRAGDQTIFDRIAEHCPREFPELMSWIEAARSD